MIKRILIANRGEIACRIIRTCRRLGIETVAVFSDADRLSAHVRLADQAVRIGPAPSTESYLAGDRIIAAAKATEADAIHPGYGFLSENAGFADAVEAAGLIWIGPTAATIRALGLKDEAKRIAEEAGVPVLPGYRGADQGLKTLQSEADRIGYPLLIKAVAGGGGRGIREVRKALDLKAELESAVREAESAFGDGRVMLEKLVEKPRHIEVQVFGDGKGKAVHLFERDCSLQRRRQKVIEEAPAPGMTAPVRKAMTDAAVRLASAVSYRGAGTIEFIVDGTRPLAPDTFFFLEMNTRLQVEHPVTEMVTGVDLVEWQIRVAAGERLPAKQSDIRLNGHAIESRICAEDPADGFRPGAGRLTLFEPPIAPSEAHDMRWETGFSTGDTVPSTYDSMIAKLVVYAEDRPSAIARSIELLSQTPLLGVPSNIGFLTRCLQSDTFGAGEHHVNWIAAQGEGLTVTPATVREVACAVGARVIALGDETERNADGPWGVRDGFRVNSAPQTALRVRCDDEVVTVDLAAPFREDWPSPVVHVLSERRVAVTVAGETCLVARPDFETDAEAIGGGDIIAAPMPGKLLTIAVKPGDHVEKGSPVAVMEAMKMEHTLTAPRSGEVEGVEAGPGEQLSEGHVIIRLIAEAD